MCYETAETTALRRRPVGYVGKEPARKGAKKRPDLSGVGKESTSR